MRCRVCESTVPPRGRQIVPDAPDAPDVPAAADVLQVAHSELSGLHKLCAAHDHKVSVDTDNASSTQLSTNGITPLTDRKYRCTYCASLGQCKKHCFTKRRRLANGATKKSSGGISRTSGCLKSNPPIRSSPSKQRYTRLGEFEVNSLLCFKRVKL